MDVYIENSYLVTEHENGAFYEQYIPEWRERVIELMSREQTPFAFEFDLMGTFLKDLAATRY